MLIGAGAFAAYGVASYANGERQLLQSNSYDPLSGTSQEIVRPAVLEYLVVREEHRFQAGLN